MENGFLFTYQTKGDILGVRKKDVSESPDYLVKTDSIRKTFFIPNVINDLMLVCFGKPVTEQLLDEVDLAQKGEIDWVQVGLYWLQPLWWVSLLVLPFTLWSLVTQAFVIRNWCLLCCSVVFLLWVNAVILLLFFPVMTAIPEVAMLALLIIVCAVPVAAMEATKTIGSKARKYA